MMNVTGIYEVYDTETGETIYQQENEISPLMYLFVFQMGLLYKVPYQFTNNVKRYFVPNDGYLSSNSIGEQSNLNPTIAVTNAKIDVKNQTTRIGQFQNNFNYNQVVQNYQASPNTRLFTGIHSFQRIIGSTDYYKDQDYNYGMIRIDREDETHYVINFEGFQNINFDIGAFDFVTDVNSLFSIYGSADFNASYYSGLVDRRVIPFPDNYQKQIKYSHSYGNEQTMYINYSEGLHTLLNSANNIYSNDEEKERVRQTIINDFKKENPDYVNSYFLYQKLLQNTFGNQYGKNVALLSSTILKKPYILARTNHRGIRYRIVIKNFGKNHLHGDYYPVVDNSPFRKDIVFKSDIVVNGKSAKLYMNDITPFSFQYSNDTIINDEIYVGNNSRTTNEVNMLSFHSRKASIIRVLDGNNVIHEFEHNQVNPYIVFDGDEKDGFNFSFLNLKDVQLDGISSIKAILFFQKPVNDYHATVFNYSYLIAFVEPLEVPKNPNKVSTIKKLQLGFTAKKKLLE